MKTPDIKICGLALLLACALAACATQGRAKVQTERSQLETRVHALLTAYAADNQEAVWQMTDTASVSFYGSDVSEHATSKPQLQQMMSDDFKLWHTARFGAPHDLDIRLGGDLATTLFDVPFSAGGGPDVDVRMFVVWKKVHGEWLVTQSASSVPTVGSSARDLLRRH